MNIVLIGTRGSGKSAVAAMLSSSLGIPKACLDEEIVRRAASSIPEIVESRGWDHFRDLESAVVQDFSRRDGWILDTGGGVILRDHNVRALRENGFLVWLQAPPPVLSARIQGDTQRPALKAGKTFLEEIAEVLQEREPLYRAAADQELDTSRLSPEQVSFAIQDAIRKRGLKVPG